MIGENKIVVAAAGSGKTTYLVEEATKIKGERVLITTYTESNEAEIRQKFFDLVGHVPANVVIVPVRASIFRTRKLNASAR